MYNDTRYRGLSVICVLFMLPVKPILECAKIVFHY